MRFFTQELLDLFNSEDDEIADQASEEWERRIIEYRNYGDTLDLPITNNYFLHDSRLISFENIGNSLKLKLRLEPPNPETIIIEYKVIDLKYFKDKMDGRLYFLYDEFDKENNFLKHSILFNNKAEIQVVFSEIKIHESC